MEPAAQKDISILDSAKQPEVVAISPSINDISTLGRHSAFQDDTGVGGSTPESPSIPSSPGPTRGEDREQEEELQQGKHIQAHTQTEDPGLAALSGQVPQSDQRQEGEVPQDEERPEVQPRLQDRQTEVPQEITFLQIRHANTDIFAWMASHAVAEIESSLSSRDVGYWTSTKQAVYKHFLEWRKNISVIRNTSSQILVFASRRWKAKQAILPQYQYL